MAVEPKVAGRVARPRVFVCVLDSTEQALEAERRLRGGGRQVYCPTCRRWRWREECAHEGRLTEAQFRRWSKEAARDGD